MPIIGGRGAGVRGLGFQGAGRPAQVTGLTATNLGSGRAFNNGRIDLAWSAPATNGAPITGYRIEQSTNSGSTWSDLVANTGTTSVSYSHTGLTSAQRYDYRVSAINAVGTGTASSAANATATTVPQAPTIGTATGGSASASVAFTINATGGSSINGYTATSSPGSITNTGTSSPITVSSLTNGTAYTFTVTATNVNGTSAVSAPSNSITPVAPVSYWINITGDGTQNYARSVAKDTSGNFYPVGSFDTSRAWLGKYNSSGVLQWQRALTNPALRPNFLYGAEADSSGNVYASGFYYTGPSARTGYIVKYDTSGTNQWAYIAGPFVGEYAGMALDSSANLHVIGVFRQESILKLDWYVLKFNSAGTLLWQKTLGGSATNHGGLDIAVSSSGDVYATGTLSVSNAVRTGVAKYNSSGTLQWQIADNLVSSLGYGVNVDSSGNVLVAGKYYNGSADTGTISKFNSSGTLQWQRQITGAGNSAVGVGTDSANNVYVCGYDYSTTPNYIYVRKYDASGVIQWQRRLRSASGNILPGNYNPMKVDTAGNITIAGECNFSVSVTRDMMTFSLPGDGSKTGTYNVTIQGNTFAIIYDASSLTDSAGTATFSASSLVDGTPTNARGSASLGLLTSNFSSSTVTI